MKLTFGDAVDGDVTALTALHADAAADLTTRFGPGHWSNAATVRRVDPPSSFSRLRVGRYRGRVVTVLRLMTKKPWAIDVSYFTPVRWPLYLTGMVVAVAQQGRGLGRTALEDARQLAAAWPADAIRLDAYDAAAGAGAFYGRCGYTERGCAVYRKNPLVYYELLLS